MSNHHYVKETGVARAGVTPMLSTTYSQVSFITSVQKKFICEYSDLL